MIASVKSELRKLFSVRSTYLISGFVFLMVFFFAFYIEGIKTSPEALMSPNRLASEVTSAILAVSVFISLVGLLLMSHEYRYNTIMYTLTSSKSRTRTLFAKIIAVSAYAITMSLIVIVLSPILTYLGVHVKGLSLVNQIIPAGNLLWRCLFYGWGYAMAALLIATLVRSQIGAFAAVFLLPVAVESLLALVLKSNAVYMPFTALSQVVGTPGGEHGPQLAASLSPGKGALVFTAYLVVGWIVAWVLFLRRDAN